jgi:hypothetical protein
MAPPPKRAPERDALFFTALENAHSVAFACRAAGYSVPSVYRWRAEEAEFAERWDQSITIAADLLEDEADRRGRDGYDEPVFCKGQEVGQKRRYSDRLLLARLKALRPHLYREGAAPAVASPTPTVIVRDFSMEADLLRFLAEGKITLEDLTPALRARAEKWRAEAE